MAMDKINEDYDSKLQSFTTLNTCNHEMQQEIANLGQKLISKDEMIACLKSRLAKFERTCVTEGDAPIFIGPSKCLVESLCRELCKAKQKLKETEADASQKLEYSKRETQVMQQKLQEKEQELERVLQCPEYQTHQEIERLQACLLERDRVQATRDVLCSSLVEESEQLRRQLGATVRMCKDLLGRLEGGNETNIEDKAHGKQMTGFSDPVHLNSLVSKLQMENEQLRERVAYVENLNSKWQRYDQSREQYVKGLCQKLREATGSKAIHQDEIVRLNVLLEDKMLECERVNAERETCALRDQERIQVLEQQILAYVEDFKSERADRERAQGKIQDLQEQLQQQIHRQNSSEGSSSRHHHSK